MAGSVGPRYFETMNTAILYGREFTADDKSDSERTAIINETFARHLFSGLRSPAEVVGKRISFESATGPFVRIVGVAQDGKTSISRKSRACAWLWTPTTQNYWALILVVQIAAIQQQSHLYATKPSALIPTAHI
jgi:hypothetical protein